MHGARDSLFLLLKTVPRLGGAEIEALMGRFAGPDAFWSAPAFDGCRSGNAAALEQLRRLGDRSPQWQQVLAWRDGMNRQGIGLVFRDDATYPPLLREIHQPPPALFVRGVAAVLVRPHIAVVGSRNASRAGLSLAADFAAELAAMGFVICSGLALGIDGAAHRSALRAGGCTTAVMGTGLDRIYPAQHGPLALDIAASGALVTEFVPGTPPLRGHFPRRNRIIAGLCMGTLVVEAALHSGSLITARLAMECNREVFAIPGSIHNPRCRGTHALIRQGAKLVETAAHIVEELPGLLQYHLSDSQLRPGPAVAAGVDGRPNPAGSARTALEAVDYHPTTLDEVARRSGLPPAELAALMLELELAGWVESVAGAFQRCR